MTTESPPNAQRSAAAAGDTAVCMPLRIDPTKPVWLDAFGRKASGKSVWAARYYHSWPYDSLVIDPSHDFDVGDNVETLTDPLPHHLTESDRGEPPKRYVYRPDPGSPTYKDDLDRAVGLAFFTSKDRPFLLVVDEIGELTDAGQTGANLRRALHQSRHRNLSLIITGPRCKDINPLVLSQADYVAFFEMPNELDQARAAQTCGLSLRRFHQANLDLPPYHYLLYTAQPDPQLVAELARQEGLTEKDAKDQLRLVECPPVPLRAR